MMVCDLRYVVSCCAGRGVHVHLGRKQQLLRWCGCVRTTAMRHCGGVFAGVLLCGFMLCWARPASALAFAFNKQLLVQVCSATLCALL